MPKAIDLNALRHSRFLFDKFLSSKSYPSYTSNIADSIPEISQLISFELTCKVRELLSGANIRLCNVEGHYLPPGSPPIPAHQDNFYHCLVDGCGLKILIPMADFNDSHGSLTYLDCPSCIGTKPHSPSSTQNFSAEIKRENLSQLNYQRTCYNYTFGDASYHLLNSIHFSHGNKSNLPASFLVFRYQLSKAKIDEEARKKYLQCYSSHLDLLARSN